MLNLVYVGVGGCIGAMLRYVISIASSKIFTTAIPCGTLIVNVLGGILIGFIMELSLSTNIVSPNMKLLLTTGIMGGLTTFSTFSYESISLFINGNVLFGTLNICLNLFLSLGGVLLGQFVALKLV